MNNESIKALIFEDDKDYAGFLETVIREYVPEISEVSVAHNFKEALEKINLSEPDLLFLDIVIGEENGLKFLKGLPEQLHGIDVIVISGHEQFALDATHYHIFDFLTKPISPLDVRNSVRELINYRNQRNKTQKVYHNEVYEPMFIVVNRQDKAFFIKKNQILSLEADGPYTNILTTDGRLSASKTMAYFLEQLDPQKFCRISRSLVINIDYIKEVVKLGDRSGNLIMQGGESIPISKEKKDLLIKLISKGEVGKEQSE